MQRGMRIQLRLEDEEPVKQGGEGRAGKIIWIEHFTPQRPGQDLKQIRSVKTPAKNRDRDQQAKYAGEQARQECFPVLFTDKVQRQDDGENLDRYTQGNQRSSHAIPLPLYCPTRGGQNAKQNDVVLAIEKVPMQGEGES